MYYIVILWYLHQPAGLCIIITTVVSPTRWVMYYIITTVVSPLTRWVMYYIVLLSISTNLLGYVLFCHRMQHPPGHVLHLSCIS